MGKKIKSDTTALNEAIDNWKRAVADYQNLEKRVIEERREWTINANKELIRRFLQVLDTLTLASRHVSDEGLALAIKQFTDALKDEGIERIQTEGQVFNPNTMECVDTEEGEEGKVLEEVRAGYTINGTVLRPAQVKVGKANLNEKEETLAKEQLQKGDYM